jgi:hypothetical protein
VQGVARFELNESTCINSRPGTHLIQLHGSGGTLALVVQQGPQGHTSLIVQVLAAQHADTDAQWLTAHMLLPHVLCQGRARQQKWGPHVISESFQHTTAAAAVAAAGTAAAASTAQLCRTHRQHMQCSTQLPVQQQLPQYMNSTTAIAVQHQVRCAPTPAASKPASQPVSQSVPQPPPTGMV